MARALNNIPAIESFVVERSKTTNLSKKWDTWKEDFTLFVTASGITNVEQKRALFLHMAGKEVKEIYRTMATAGETYENMITKLDDYFTPKKNLTYERYIFKKTEQLVSEDSITYITRLRRLGTSCEYQNIENEIRDQFIVTCKSTKLRKPLLREENLTLDKLKTITSREETAISQTSEIENQKSAEKVSQVSNKFNNKRC